MTVRHAALSIGAVLVLGLGVYLLVEVRSHAVPRAAGSREVLASRSRAAQPARPTAAPPPAAMRAGDGPPRSAPLPAAPSALPQAGSAPAAGGADDQPDPEFVGPRLDAVMTEANKAYDRGDLDEAKAIATRVLARFPSNVRMLRIMVSASCIDGDTAIAQESYAKLPPADQVQMRVRCARYGVAFPDKQ